MMQGKVSHLLRMVAPIALVLSLLFFLTPVIRAWAAQPTLIGPKSTYLAVGDSLAFGYQPLLGFSGGYTDDFYKNLKSHGTKNFDNLSCPGEDTTTMINGQCPAPFLRKYPYIGSQLGAAVDYLHDHAGQVSPVTLDIGANDIVGDMDYSTCVISSQATADLKTMDYNLTHTILPKLTAAMTVNGQMTGDLLIMNYYDPYQNHCPNTVAFVQELNQHLAADASGYGTMVDVFDAFGGATVPNPNLCNYTWMCSVYPSDLGIHATDTGYQVIAKAFEQTTGY
ncbi:MAG TPA: SGNH/GDSL hydrolase family protein [Ktedonobacteraceae bacterium]|jgi:lysophospholipase L1-like esterase